LVVAVKPGQAVDFAGYTLTFQGLERRQGPNYAEDAGTFLLARDGRDITTLTSSKRQYFAPRNTTSEAAIHLSLAGDYYLVLGDGAPDGEVAARIYFNPLVRLIWIGAIIMFLGGLLSLSDRRLRIGAPNRAPAPGKLAAEPS
jgi:cytochrome c-type biogenesis protein CcmF